MSDDVPYISVIIPACNEEAFIAGAIESIFSAAAAASTTFEIIVVLNRCTDGTEAIAHAHGCRTIHNDEKNLSAIRNAGARTARGTIIVTLDADSRASKNTFLEIKRALSTGRSVGGGTVILPERWSLGILLTGIFLLPAILLERLSGGLFFVTKKDFDSLGGFDETIYSAEDIDFARRLKKLGRETGRKFTTLWRAPIITSCRKFDRFGDWFFIKNPLMAIKLLRGKDRRYADIVWYDFHSTQPENSTPPQKE